MYGTSGHPTGYDSSKNQLSYAFDKRGRLERRTAKGRELAIISGVLNPMTGTPTMLDDIGLAEALLGLDRSRVLAVHKQPAELSVVVETMGC